MVAFDRHVQLFRLYFTYHRVSSRISTIMSQFARRLAKFIVVCKIIALVRVLGCSIVFLPSTCLLGRVTVSTFLLRVGSKQLDAKRLTVSFKAEA